MPLTDSEIRALQPSSKAVCKGIGGGLCIYVEPEIKGGGKSFRERCITKKEVQTRKD